MQWNREQQEALNAVGRWLKDPNKQQVFRMFGFAGVGKTTLAQYLADGAGRVLFGAYTGKAASVLRDKGCFGAATIHQLIYVPAEKSKKRLRELQEAYAELAVELSPEEREHSTKLKQLRADISREEENVKQPAFTLNLESPVEDADLVIIDECSMVDERMGEDLLSFDVPVLVLGDPAQLPPVRGGGYFTSKTPDIMLTEIHRQARDNPIIDLATRVREGQELRPGQYGESLVMEGKPPVDLVRSADQILTGANATRRRCNARMRRLLGHGEDPCPVEGDKLVCLRNDHEVGLLNGTIWHTEAVRPVEGLGSKDRINLLIRNGDEYSLDVEAHMHYFEGREKDLPYWEIRSAQCFDFGYALTTHKAQGSQWDSVFIFDESYVFRQNARRWLYTAITRAAEKVVICR